MNGSHTLRTAASPGELGRIREFVLDAARELGIADSLGPKLDLAVEEVLINIASYAYPVDGGEVEIACGKDETDRFWLRFVDEGTPFDPSVKQSPDIEGDMDHRSVGGLGVFLVQQMTDEMHYERREGTNRLTLFFKHETTP